MRCYAPIGFLSLINGCPIRTMFFFCKINRLQVGVHVIEKISFILYENGNQFCHIWFWCRTV